MNKLIMIMLAVTSPLAIYAMNEEKQATQTIVNEVPAIINQDLTYEKHPALPEAFYQKKVASFISAHGLVRGTEVEKTLLRFISDKYKEINDNKPTQPLIDQLKNKLITVEGPGLLAASGVIAASILKAYALLCHNVMEAAARKILGVRKSSLPHDTDETWSLTAVSDDQYNNAARQNYTIESFIIGKLREESKCHQLYFDTLYPELKHFDVKA